VRIGNCACFPVADQETGNRTYKRERSIITFTNRF